VETPTHPEPRISRIEAGQKTRGRQPSPSDLTRGATGTGWRRTRQARAPRAKSLGNLSDQARARAFVQFSGERATSTTNRCLAWLGSAARLRSSRLLPWTWSAVFWLLGARENVEERVRLRTAKSRFPCAHAECGGVYCSRSPTYRERSL
jgi:hypothetical protein